MPSLDEGDTCVARPRLAAVTAVHLVGQVLDEAYVIATAAKETGEPWEYSTLVRKFKEGKMGESYNISLFKIPYKSENDDANKLIDITDKTGTPHTFSASTPVKLQDDAAKMIEEFIGQGDECSELLQNEFNYTSTSTFINTLFDMSEIEQNVFNYDVSAPQSSSENYESLIQTVSKILESYVNLALAIVLDSDTQDKVQVDEKVSESTELSSFSYLADAFEIEQTVFNYDVSAPQSISENYESLMQTVTRILDSYVDLALATVLDGATQDKVQDEKLSKNTELSSFSYLADAFEVDLINRKTLNIKDDIFENNIVTATEISPEILPNMFYDTALERKDDDDTQEKEKRKVINIITEQMIQNKYQSDAKPEYPLYENTYLTLNRDYDQYSEDYDVVAVCLDSKVAVLQEIELLNSNSSEENIKTCVENEKSDKNHTEFAAISGVSQGSRKSSLARRCRAQGAKLLACLRGWWRRNSSKKQKVFRNSEEVRGFRHLSPDARRRAASLLDQRVCSPSTSRSVIWKFNTVNETVVNTNRWKNYSFELPTNEYGE